MRIRLESVRVCYGETVALAGLDLEVGPGEWLGLVGPSGSGKTSALRAIAGFERIADGRIALDDVTVADRRAHRPPEKRGPGFVFQEFALFPHLSAARNIEFGLGHLPRPARAERARAMLALVELADYGARAPAALSGGQQQRIALARALAPEPPALLMDEPFGSLDPGLRSAVRERVVETLRARGCTVVFISHDIDEALAIADRIAVLRAGRLEQIGAPEALYDRPANAFVAGFLGPVNLLPGAADGAALRTALGPLSLARPASGPRQAVIRPHRLAIDPAGVRGAVARRTYRGHLVELIVDLADGTRLRAHVPPEDAPRPGATVCLAARGPVETVPG